MPSCAPMLPMQNPDVTKPAKSSNKIPDVKPSKREPIFNLIDSFFLFCEENRADPDSETTWKTEEDEEGLEAEDKIIEQAENITLLYESLVDSDEIKSKIRKYIVKQVDLFNFKNEEAIEYLYFDNYFEFLTSDDF